MHAPTRTKALPAAYVAYLSAPEEEGKRLKPFEWTWRCDIVGGGSELAHGFGGGGWMKGEGLGGGGDGGDGGGGGAGGGGRGGRRRPGRAHDARDSQYVHVGGCEGSDSTWFEGCMLTLKLEESS